MKHSCFGFKTSETATDNVCSIGCNEKERRECFEETMRILKKVHGRS